MVKAKLFVSHIARDAHAPDSIHVHFGAVTRGEENRQWAEASPSADFKMTINNPAAAAAFVLGQEFFVTFEPAEIRPQLSDGHAFEPRDASHEWGAKHCGLCGCRKASHEEPLRSALIASMRI
jgi:hypothetical protein